MANPEHVKLVKQGAAAIEKWRAREPRGQLDLSKADLTRAILGGADLSGARLGFANYSEMDPAAIANVRSRLPGANLNGAILVHANLIEANLTRAMLVEADLRNADLPEAHLHYANLSNANLEGARLMEADLRVANLRGANLRGANLIRADLAEANLHGADLRDANLEGADLSDADLSRANLRDANLARSKLVEARIHETVLTGCRVYGASAWNLDGDPNDQSDLIITPDTEPDLRVADLEVAQFIYLLLNNENVRKVIDTITSKVVLILGSFSDKRKAVLDAIREELQQRDLTPVIFDFNKPASKDVTGTVATLAGMARFIIADLTDPKSIPAELHTVVPHLRQTPVVSLLLRGEKTYSMFEDLRAYPWVLDTHEYEDTQQLIAQLPEVIAPADKRAEEMRQS